MRVARLLPLLLASAVIPAGAEDAPKETPTIGPRDLTLEGERVHVVLPPDVLKSIDAPEFLSRTEADSVYSDAEPVLGVAINGEAHAYSLWHLDAHEIVNDELGGSAIASTW